MCLEIKDSIVAKSPEYFSGAQKLAKTKNPIFSKKLVSQKSMCNYLEIFKI